MINYEHFSAMELRVATVITAERVEGSEKLLKLQLDLGERDATGLPAGPLRPPRLGEAGRSFSEASRQVIAGIGKAYTPEELVGTQIIIVANLEPRSLMGQQSNGMLLAARDQSEVPVLLRPQRTVSAGSKIN